MKIPRTGPERDAYIKKLNQLNEFDRLVENLCTSELSMFHLEAAFAEYIRRADHLPEGVKNQLVSSADNNRGLLTHCWVMIKQTVGVCELSYRRGKLENES